MAEAGVPESKAKGGGGNGVRTTLNSRKQVHRAMAVRSAAALRAGQARNQQDSAWGGSDLAFLQQRRCDWAGGQASYREPRAHPPPPIPRGFFLNSTDRLGGGALK